MIYRIWIAFVLVAAICLFSCTQQPATPTMDLAAEALAIRDASANWAAAYKAKDWAAAAAFFAPDGTFFLENREPVVGPAAIQASTEADWAEMPNASLSWAVDNVIVSASGDLAYETGSYSFSNEAERDSGKYITVWRKIDGQWKVIGDMGGSTMPREEAEQ
jgi:ketosteroid isomerase-like protein